MGRDVCGRPSHRGHVRGGLVPGSGDPNRGNQPNQLQGEGALPRLGFAVRRVACCSPSSSFSFCSSVLSSSVLSCSCTPSPATHTHTYTHAHQPFSPLRLLLLITSTWRCNCRYDEWLPASSGRLRGEHQPDSAAPISQQLSGGVARPPPKAKQVCAHGAVEGRAVGGSSGWVSRRRDRHFADTPSPWLLEHLLKKEGGVGWGGRMAVLPTARLGAVRVAGGGRAALAAR